MNAKVLAAGLLLGTSVASLACNKDKTSPTPDPAPTASAAPVTAESLPARSDEEQKASHEITSENYKTQLDQLEKEIDNP